MHTTVPTPARARASYMDLGPDVPPVILHITLPHLESLDPTIILGRALDFAASRYSGSPIRASTMSPSLSGSFSSNRSVRYACTMLSAAEWTLNSGIPSSPAASAAWLWFTPMTPLSASSVRGPIMPSATLIGTPSEWYRSAWSPMTFGNSTRDFPSGWCATRASTLAPLSLSLSARRTSPVPTSMPHIRDSASASRASSSQAEKRQSE